jgi:co-chaperonin GroES (HSP10)
MIKKYKHITVSRENPLRKGDLVIYLGHPGFGTGCVRSAYGKYCIIDFENCKNWLASVNSDTYAKIEEEEKEEEGKIRWYNKGKLEESLKELPFKVGDVVIVNNKLRYWVKKEDWDIHMLSFIGKKFTIRNIITPNSAYGTRFGSAFAALSAALSGNFWVPFECLDLAESSNHTLSIKWYKDGKLQETANPFKTIKDYGINYIIDNSFYNNILMDYPSYYNSYLRLADILDRKSPEELPRSLEYVKGVKLKRSYSQYVKFLNSIFINKLVIILYSKNGKGYITKIKVKSVLVDNKEVIGFTDKYDQKYILFELGIIDVNKYVDLRLKNLIGHKISFYSYRPKKKKFGKSVFIGREDYFVENFKLNRIYIDSNTDEICFVNNKRDVEKVNIFESITGKKIYSIEDPYGEEDWGEEDLSEEKRIKLFEKWGHDEYYYYPTKIKEKRRKEQRRKERIKDMEFSLKMGTGKYQRFGNYLLFNKLGLWRLNVLRKFLVGKIIIIEQLCDKNKKRTKGRVIHIGQFKAADEQYYSVKMMTKKGEVDISICGKDGFIVSKEKVKKTKIDPYGEEDWEIFSSLKDIKRPIEKPIEEQKPKKDETINKFGEEDWTS